MFKQRPIWIILTGILGLGIVAWLLGWATPTFSYATAAPTEAAAIFLPLAAHAEPTLPGIQGYTTDNGQPVGGIALELRRYSGGSWSSQGSTQTDSAGFFRFTPPSLSSGQRYYVRYVNPENLTTRLAFWGTHELTSYSAGQTVYIGDFDVHNIELQTPAPGATVNVPTTFHWATRPATPSDSYEFDLFDYDDGDPYFYTEPPLGYVGACTLNHLPGRFAPGVQYAWGLAAYSPDGGIGLSYWVYGVIFASNGAQIAPIPARSLPGWADDRPIVPAQHLAPTP